MIWPSLKVVLDLIEACLYGQIRFQVSFEQLLHSVGAAVALSQYHNSVQHHFLMNGIDADDGPRALGGLAARRWQRKRCTSGQLSH